MGWQDAPLVEERKKTSWQDAPLVESAPAKPATWGESFSDLAEQAPRRAMRGLVALPNAAYNVLDWAGEKATGGSFLPDLETSELYHQIENVPEAKTTTGRYGGAVAEAAGGSVLPGAGIYGAAARLPAAARAGEGFVARNLLRPIKDAPGKALGYDAASVAGSGVASQGAQDAGVGPGGQLAAGLLGGVAAPLGVAGAFAGASRAAPTFSRLMADESGAMRLPGSQGPRPPKTNKLDRETYDMAADAARAAGIKPHEFDDWLRQIEWARTYHTAGNYVSQAPDVLSLAEMNPAFARLVGSSVRENVEAANVARPAIAAKQFGYAKEGPVDPSLGIPTVNKYAKTPDKGGPNAGMQRRVIDAERRALRIEDELSHGHERTADLTVDAIAAAQEAAARPAYANMRFAGRGVDISANKNVTNVFNFWTKEANREGLPAADKTMITRALNQFAPNGKMIKNIKDFDRAKRLADDQIAVLQAAGKREEAAKMLRLKNNFLDAVDLIQDNNLGALYREARHTFSGPEQAKREIELGRAVYKGTADRAAFDAMDRGAQKRVKLGYHSAFAGDVLEKQGSADITKVMTSGKHREDMAYLIERSGQTPTGRQSKTKNKQTGQMEPVETVYGDRPERFEGYIRGQEATIQSRDIIKGGSPTAERLADDAAFDVLHTLQEAIKGGKSVGDITARLVELGVKKLFGNRSDLTVNLVKKLMSSDPEIRARTAAEIKLRLSTSKQERFNEIMRQVAREATRPTARTAAASAAPASQRQQEPK